MFTTVDVCDARIKTKPLRDIAESCTATFTTKKVTIRLV